MKAAAARIPATQEERNLRAKERICAAALELFAINGYERTTLVEIGMRAGYSRGIVAYHFGTKADLSALLIDARCRRDTFLADLTLEPATSGEDAWKQLHRHLEHSWSNFRETLMDGEPSLRARGELILSAAANFSSDDSLRKTVEDYGRMLCADVSAILDRCKADGIVRGNVDVQATATFYVYSIWGMANAMIINHTNRDAVLASINCLRQFLASLRCDGLDPANRPTA